MVVAKFSIQTEFVRIQCQSVKRNAPGKHLNHSVWHSMLQKDLSYVCQGRVDEVKISVSGSDTASKVDYTIF